ITEFMENNIEFDSLDKTSRKKNKLKIRKAWILALCLLAFGTTLYSEIEGQWFSSFASVIANMSYFGVSTMVALAGIFGTIFYLVWGAISDNLRTNLGRRIPIILIGMVSTAGLMIFYILTTYFLLLLVIGGFFLALTSNMFHVTNKSLIGDLIPIEKRGRINSILFIATNMGSMTVWIPAIILLPEGTETFSRDVHSIFIGGGALLLVIVGILVTLLVKEPKENSAPRNWRHDLKKLLNRKEMMQYKNFLRLFVAMLFLIMSQYAFTPFLLILLQEISLSLTEILIFLPIIGTAIGLGIFLLGRYVDTIGRKKIALICLIISPIGCFIITFLGSRYQFLLIGFGIMMPFNIGLWLATDAWTLDLLPEESRGRFLGIINIGNAIARVPGVLIAGYLADTFGILWVFFITGIILWIGIPFFLRVPETIKIKNDKIE
ncbi:MAG: MFS transporter, partial [Candidatus Hermodarchaeota archaeon]